MTPASQVETRILSGDYVFLYYATTRWLDQVRICAELIGDEGVMSEELNNLCKEIETLFLRQENEAYTGKVTNSRRNRNTYQVFREYSPEIYEKLTGEKSFWDHRVPFLQLSEGEKHLLFCSFSKRDVDWPCNEKRLLEDRLTDDCDIRFVCLLH